MFYVRAFCCRGFSVSVCGRQHIFKPVSVQAMWWVLAESWCLHIYRKCSMGSMPYTVKAAVYGLSALHSRCWLVGRAIRFTAFGWPVACGNPAGQVKLILSTGPGTVEGMGRQTRVKWNFCLCWLMRLYAVSCLKREEVVCSAIFLIWDILRIWFFN